MSIVPRRGCGATTVSSAQPSAPAIASLRLSRERARAASASGSFRTVFGSTNSGATCFARSVSSAGPSRDLRTDSTDVSRSSPSVFAFPTLLAIRFATPGSTSERCVRISSTLQAFASGRRAASSGDRPSTARRTAARVSSRVAAISAILGCIPEILGPRGAAVEGEIRHGRAVDGNQCRSKGPVR